MKYNFFYTISLISSFVFAATAGVDFSTPDRFDPNRSKRSVTNVDTRFKLDMATYGNTFPFSSAVYFSHGCSGTLLTPTHALTSASCFHNGRNFVRGSMKAKVGKYLHTNQSTTRNSSASIAWTDIKKVHLPPIWTNVKARRRRKARFPYGANFAVVQLTGKLPGHPMPVGVFDRDGSERLHMTNYNLRDHFKMLYRFCDVTRAGPELVNTDCDAEDAYASGAGIYVIGVTSRGAPVRKLVAVYTSMTPVKRGSRAVRVTGGKRRQICLWVNEGDAKKCGQYEGDRGVSRSQRHNSLNRSQLYKSRKLRNRHKLLINEVNKSDGQRRKLRVSRRKYPKQFKSKTVDFRKSSKLRKYRRTRTGLGSETPLQGGEPAEK